MMEPRVSGLQVVPANLPRHRFVQGVHADPHPGEEAHEALRVLVSTVGDGVGAGAHISCELGHLEEVVVQSGLALALQGHDIRDAMSRSVPLQQRRECLIRHIALAHQAPGTVEAVEIAAGCDFKLSNHAEPRGYRTTLVTTSMRQRPSMHEFEQIVK